ncbi:hypothetical protein L345_15829, partial [Ophiophagus hannah]
MQRLLRGNVDPGKEIYIHWTAQAGEVKMATPEILVPFFRRIHTPLYTDSIRQQWDHKPCSPTCIRPRGCENLSFTHPSCHLHSCWSDLPSSCGHWLLGRKEGVFKGVDINRGAEESTPSYTGAHQPRRGVCNLPRIMGTEKKHGYLNPFFYEPPAAKKKKKRESNLPLDPSEKNTTRFLGRAKGSCLLQSSGIVPLLSVSGRPRDWNGPGSLARGQQEGRRSLPVRGQELANHQKMPENVVSQNGRAGRREGRTPSRLDPSSILDGGGCLSSQESLKPWRRRTLGLWKALRKALDVAVGLQAGKEDVEQPEAHEEASGQDFGALGTPQLSPYVGSPAVHEDADTNEGKDGEEGDGESQGACLHLKVFALESPVDGRHGPGHPQAQEDVDRIAARHVADRRIRTLVLQGSHFAGKGICGKRRVLSMYNRHGVVELTGWPCPSHPAPPCSPVKNRLNWKFWKSGNGPVSGFRRPSGEQGRPFSPSQRPEGSFRNLGKAKNDPPRSSVNQFLNPTPDNRGVKLKAHEPDLVCNVVGSDPRGHWARVASAQSTQCKEETCQKFGEWLHDGCKSRTTWKSLTGLRCTWDGGAQGHKDDRIHGVLEPHGAAKVGGQVADQSGQHADDQDANTEAGPAVPVLGGRHTGEENLPEDGQEMHDIVEARGQPLLPPVFILIFDTWGEEHLSQRFSTDGRRWAEEDGGIKQDLPARSLVLSEVEGSGVPEEEEEEEDDNGQEGAGPASGMFYWFSKLHRMNPTPGSTCSIGGNQLPLETALQSVGFLPPPLPPPPPRPPPPHW